MQKTIGGNRLGSGKKMQVDLHGYERSTHDLSYVWRSTMSSGTLVPFMSEIALPGDTFDINLDLMMNTHPTIGPLFGSYKAQLDVFLTPIRLYNSLLHNNMIGIGMDMSQIKFPTITLTAKPTTNTIPTLDNIQINPSCILAYLGIRGIGYNTAATNTERSFNGIPLLCYWDIYKQYYSNKAEEIGYVIHTPMPTIITTITKIEMQNPPSAAVLIPNDSGNANFNTQNSTQIIITFSGTQPDPKQIMLETAQHGIITLHEFSTGVWTATATTLTSTYAWYRWGSATNVRRWKYTTAVDNAAGMPKLVAFPLNYIDDMRKEILKYNSTSVPFEIVGTASPQQIPPYAYLDGMSNGTPDTLSSQEGLGLKTYQSDQFNNWISTDWIDGPNGITQTTAIDTSGGNFTLDTLNISQKVYELLNRIAISGGTYDDWLDAVYATERYKRCETPMYMGGLSKELVFQEIVSQTDVEGQPLGTLAGKGTLSQKHKGGNITIKVDEPSYITGIISLTPRIDYSQGNKWDVNLQTMDDLHKPGLDEIGFQELITENLTWWDTQWNTTSQKWEQLSAGKQPAWLNYMTNVNRTYGNFAIPDNEMFMTLNRRYEFDPTTTHIKDLTTYIDPSKFNFIFAETALDAQNFWAQISVDMIARRKMSNKIMPNL